MIHDTLSPTSSVMGVPGRSGMFAIRGAFAAAQPTLRDSTSVTISEEGRRAMLAEGSPQEDATRLDVSLETDELIRKYDFHAITPNQFTQLGVELFRRGEITQDAANSFISVEMNTVVEMNPNQPIDMVAHFQRMLAAAQKMAQSGETSDFAVRYREQATNALSKLVEISEQGHLR